MKVSISKYNKLGQKQKIVIDKYDTYSLDHTLSYIVLPMLLQLKELKHGVPNEFAKVGGESYDEQYSFDFYTDTVDENFDKATQAWDDILNKMIWSFYQIAYVDYDSLYHHGKRDYEFKKSDTQYEHPITKQKQDTFEIVDKDPDSHWFDYVGLELHNERIQEGLDLFAKYYRNLWD